ARGTLLDRPPTQLHGHPSRCGGTTGKACGGARPALGGGSSDERAGAPHRSGAESRARRVVPGVLAAPGVGLADGRPYAQRGPAGRCLPPTPTACRV
ncbi:MAG: hypothetical protein AVDCRST_MAG77-3350, partial [uncultured Chloroflexi bacterium]